MFNLVSKLLDDPASAESRLLKEMLREAPELPDWSAAVQAVLARLLERNQIQRPLVCRVLALRQLNAVALPHRTIVVSQPLVEFCRDQADQMAFVVAHEVAHVHLGHARASSWADTVLDLAPVANPILGMGLRFLFDRAYSREQELAADQWAAYWMAGAGYSAAASVALLQRLVGADVTRGLVSELLRTHPPIQDRVRVLSEAVRAYQPG
jgi:Zn-dependent protease with chaperone function